MGLPRSVLAGCRKPRRGWYRTDTLVLGVTSEAGWLGWVTGGYLLGSSVIDLQQEEESVVQEWARAFFV